MMRWRAALLLLALLVAPGVALADPITVVTFVAYAAQAAGYISAVTAFAVAVGAGLARSWQARSQAASARRKARAQYNASLSDRTVSVLQADPPWRIIYGECVVAGTPVAIFTSDKTSVDGFGRSSTKPDALKHVVWAIARHECDACVEVTVAGKPVNLATVDANGWATTGDWANTEVKLVEKLIDPSSSYTFPAAVTVKSCLSAPASSDQTPTTATYTLSNSNKTVNNPNAFPITVSVTYSQQTSKVRVSVHLGTATQAVDAYLNSVLPSSWTSTAQGKGVCYAVVTYDLEESQFQGGPPDTLFHMRGRKVYDPRTSTTAYSTNAALCIRDWLLQPWGYGISASEINAATLIASANMCDEVIGLVKVHVGGSTLTFNEPRYTINGSFTTDDDRESILADMADAMAGDVFPGPDWQIQAGGWTAPVMALTDDDLDGAISIVQAGAPIASIFNGVRGTFINLGESAVSEMQPYQNSTYVTADGEELWETVSYPYTSSPMRARNLSRIAVEKARAGLVINYPAKLKAWPLQVGDRVTIDSTLFGWSAKTFRVVNWAWAPDAPVTLQLQEDSASIYDLVDSTQVDDNPNTGLPDPWTVAAPAGMTLSSGTSELLLLSDGTLDTRCRVSWTLSTNAYVAQGGRMEVMWRRAAVDAAGHWNVMTLGGSDTATYITGLRDGDVLNIGLTAINSLGVRSTTVYGTHTVVGKTQPPSNPTTIAQEIVNGGIRIKVPPCPDIDGACTVLRVGASWAAGVPLVGTQPTKIPIPGAEYFWAWPAAGSYTVWAKYLDTSGNESAIAVSVAVVVDDRIKLGSSGIDIDLAGINLVPNSSFELDSNSDGLANTWSGFTNGSVGTVTRSRVTGRLYGYAQRSAVSALGTAVTNRHGFLQTIPINGSALQKACLSAWVKGAGSTTIILKAIFLDASNASLGDFSASATSTTSWQRMVCSSVSIPAATQKIQVLIFCQGRTTLGADTLDVDDVMLEESDTPSVWHPYPGEVSIGTENLQNNSATDVVFDYGLSGSAGNGPAGGATSVNTVIRTKNYANSTGKPLTIQFEGGITDSNLVWNSYYPTGTTTLEIEWSSASLSGSITICSRWPDISLMSMTISPSTMHQVTLPAGETLTINLRVRVNHTAAAKISWQSSYLRAIVLKA